MEDFYKKVSELYHAGEEDYETVLAHCSVAYRYGLDFSSTFFDLDNRRVLVKTWRNPTSPVWNPVMVHQRVWAEELDHDVFVFSHYWGAPNNILGWIPRKELEEHEAFLSGESYYHQILASELVKMPEDFRFLDPCPHEWGAIWDRFTESWECCGCGRCVHSEREREFVRSYPL